MACERKLASRVLFFKVCADWEVEKEKRSGREKKIRLAVLIGCKENGTQIFFVPEIATVLHVPFIE